MEYQLTSYLSKAVIRLRLPGASFNPLYALSGIELDDSLRDCLSRILTGISYTYRGRANLLVCRLNKKRKLPVYVPVAFAVAGALLFSRLLFLTP